MDIMIDLIIFLMFDLFSKVLFYVDVDINMGNLCVYINICFKGEDNKVDYFECLLCFLFVESKLNLDIMFVNLVVELVVEIWFYDG